MRRMAAALSVLAVIGALTAPAVSAKEKDPTQVGYEYLDALFTTGSPADAEQAVELALEDSPAYAYAVHQLALMKAEVASGGAFGNTAKKKGDNVVLCAGQSTSKGDCVTFGRFVVTKKGLLRNFSYIDGKKAERLNPPILGDGQTTTAAGVTFTLVSMFQARDALFVNFDVTGDPTGERSIYTYEATYAPPGGSPVQAAQSQGVSSSLQPGVVGPLLLVFPGTLGLGGTVTIPVNTGPPDYQDTAATIAT